MCVLSLVLTALVSSAFPAPPVEPFELKDGDRVVWLGGTFIEREQRYGYWETALTSRWPDRNITFRNLGWSGDTVWGEARAAFDTPKEGYKRLVEHTRALKPTVLFIAYGSNESFAGEAGLTRFRDQLNKLLDDLAPARARVVLLAPPHVDEERQPKGAPRDRNRDIDLYAAVIRETAAKRSAQFVQEFVIRYGTDPAAIDSSGQLNAYGYQATWNNIFNELGIKGGVMEPIELELAKPRRVTQEQLRPRVPIDPPNQAKQADSRVIARGLKPGKYTLLIDGKPIATEAENYWIESQPPVFGHTYVWQGPSLDQAEQLRHAIVRKNELYFYRWRPANETYLFGFRKQEQGQNAREIPLFDPLVDDAEKEIVRLRKPVQHWYELVPAK